MNQTAAPISILRATLWALAAAILALVLAVLPAEYGIDPTGFGRLTGLNHFAGSKVAGASTPKSSGANAGATAAAPMPSGPVNATAAGGAPPLAVWSVAHSEPFAHRTFEIHLKGDEELEYKALVARGDSLVYGWHVKEGSQVYFEFHGEPSDGKWPEGYFESYEKGEASAGAGSMVAPFTGNHGWYWLNLSDKPVTIVVELAGYYGNFGRYGEPGADASDAAAAQGKASSSAATGAAKPRV